MSSDLAVTGSSTSISTMTEEEMMDVLQSSLYPGAAVKSIKLVLGYCKASNLDPMQKPVHIVPMWDKNAKAMRDVVMPGIGLYRTNASRSGELAGIGEPEFGPMIEHELDSVKFLAPEYCRLVVQRIRADGSIGDYVAKEYWIENYATAGKDSVQPNAMWKKRPRGQLAKCAEAQALRKAFPERTGSAPTADEMEGKFMEAPEVDITPPKQDTRPSYSNADFEKNRKKWRDVIIEKRKTVDELVAMIETKATLNEEQKMTIDSWSHETE